MSKESKGLPWPRGCRASRSGLEGKVSQAPVITAEFKTLYPIRLATYLGVAKFPTFPRTYSTDHLSKLPSL